ncbi:MAG: TonB-dependent receptor [Winogradskyella sp.]|nr:TonB-dependent receptor [Winogradskyella sp.]
MKYIVYLLFVISCGSPLTLVAQTDSIQVLDAVVLSDTKLKQYASGFKITKLNDSTITKNAVSLTGLLAFNSNIYFKENGFGMVSSPSFRGTNASQTAVIWNGININSQLNGQTDFNTINSAQFNDVTIRSGGGSVQYGSGSIGGTVHLNNKLAFYNHFDNDIRVSYGSFDTKNITYSSDFGKDKWSGNLGISYVDSENDYRFLGTDLRNTNGAFHNFNVNANFGLLMSDRDVLKLYHQSFVSDRELSSSLVVPSQSSYEDENFRTMLEWSHLSKVITSQFKVAHLQELFRYFDNKDLPGYSFGKVNTLILKHNFDLRLSETLNVKSILEYNDIEGEGSSFANTDRRVFSVTALLKHQLTEKLTYGVNLRKDMTSDFESPFVFSLDALYQVSQVYALKLNGSKNFRTPTFNDLYWQPGGNLDLVPESSYQIDFGQEFDYKFVTLKLNAFYIITDDLIQWQPNNTGLWSPANIAEVENYGLESELILQKTFGKNHLQLNTNYSYTVSEDSSTKKQLVYVPFHKGNMNLAYSFKSFSMFYQHLFNGDVFITDDNLTGRNFSLNAFDVANIGFDYKIWNAISHTINLGFRINNLYNEIYQNVASRPMPNRNFNIQIHYKF